MKVSILPGRSDALLNKNIKNEKTILSWNYRINTNMKDVEGYCVKCKGKVMMKDALKKVAANGRAMMQGVCPKCGTKVTKFVKA